MLTPENKQKHTECCEELLKHYQQGRSISFEYGYWG
jgi:hypothetical protein